MADLYARILARLAEIEAVARAAGGEREHWVADGGSVHRGHPTDEVVDYAHGDVSEHIALHDPAFVLRWTAFMRQLMNSGLSVMPWVIRDLAEALDIPLDDDG